MAAINDLISQIEDKELRERIEQELDKFSKQKKFGLVFEEHFPECVPLYDVPVKKGCKVALKAGKVSEFYTVMQVEGDNVYCADKKESKLINFLKKDLVCIAEFGEPIYPCLKQIDSIYKSDDARLPAHALIQADNYHALQLLEYLYAGKVDCIYIDPPYNTGARDWKYNNDYVDSSDTYRHSKWLSMMKKRLLLAKKLLNDSGVIFISIDDGEAASLKLLCDEIFTLGHFVAQIPWRKRTSKSDVPFGISQDYESILCYAQPNFKAATKGKERKYYETPDFPNKPWRFHDLTKQTTIKERPNSNFTIINPKTKEEYPVNQLRSWAITKDTFQQYYDENRIIFPGDYDFLKISKPVLRYWKEDDMKKAGNDFGFVAASTNLPVDVGLTQDGTKELSQIFNDKRFPFPKPINLIKHLVQIATITKPNALIVDFFAGSGTTLHAVNLLNAEDGGQRQCIMVTNNEVSDDEAKALAAKGFVPGDAEWEKLGIANYVAWPRTVCSINGKDINDEPLKGNYIGSGLPMADGFKANAVFFKLGFLDKTSVQLGRQFKELLPLLWLKAGGWGKCPDSEVVSAGSTTGGQLPPYIVLPENHFAVLIDEKFFSEFEPKVNAEKEIWTAFIITDFEKGFKSMAKSLSVKKSYQLYRDYLDNFRINVERN